MFYELVHTEKCLIRLADSSIVESGGAGAVASLAFCTTSLAASLAGLTSLRTASHRI